MKAILIDSDQTVYLWEDKKIKRDLFKRDGGGKVSFVEVDSGVVIKIPAQADLKKYEVAVDTAVEQEEIEEDEVFTDPSEGFSDFLNE